MRQGLGFSAFVLLLLTTASGYAASYDGTYVGTAAALLGNTGTGKGNACAQFSAPSPLTIAGGHAQVKWGDGTLTGDVDPNGSSLCTQICRVGLKAKSTPAAASRAISKAIAYTAFPGRSAKASSIA